MSTSAELVKVDISELIVLIRDRRELITKRKNHGNRDSADDARRVNGPVGSKSQPGARISVPGLDRGTTSLTAIEPQLAEQAPSPGASRSITVTLWPSF